MVITMGLVSMANLRAMANVMVMAMAMENIKLKMNNFSVWGYTIG